MINRITSWINTLSKFGAYLSAVLLSIMVMLIFVNIIGRALFGTSILITDEYSAYLFVGVVMSALAFTLKEGAHIKINVLTNLIGKRPARFLTIASTFMALCISLFMFYFSAVMVYQSLTLDIRADTVSETKLFIPQIFILLGFLLLSFELFSRLLKIRR